MGCLEIIKTGSRLRFRKAPTNMILLISCKRGKTERNIYIFLESQNDVDELAAFLKANETAGAKTVHFFFPNDPDITDPEVSNHIVISVSGFSDGFTAFQTGCSR